MALPPHSSSHVDQVDIRDVEYLGECLEFQVRDISFVRFNSCDNVFIHIIAGQLQLIGQVPLDIW